MTREMKYRTYGIGFIALRKYYLSIYLSIYLSVICMTEQLTVMDPCGILNCTSGTAMVSGLAKPGHGPYQYKARPIMTILQHNYGMRVLL